MKSKCTEMILGCEYHKNLTSSLDDYINNRFSCISETFEIKIGHEFIIPKYCRDNVQLRSLTINFENDISSEEEILQKTIGSFIGVYIDDAQMSEISIPLCIMLSNKKFFVNSKKFTFSLPFDYLLGNLEIARIHYYNWKIIVSAENEYAFKNIYFTMISNVTDRHVPNLNELSERSIQQITSKFLSYDENSKKDGVFSTELLFSNVVKGLFIECNNIDEITEIRFEIGNEKELNLRIQCSENDIKQIAYRVHNNLLYIPFNLGVKKPDYDNISVESYSAGLNFSCIDRKLLRIKFSGKVNESKEDVFINIHAISLNILRIIQGMGGYGFSS